MLRSHERARNSLGVLADMRGSDDERVCVANKQSLHGPKHISSTVDPGRLEPVLNSATGNHDVIVFAYIVLLPVSLC